MSSRRCGNVIVTSSWRPAVSDDVSQHNRSETTSSAFTPRHAEPWIKVPVAAEEHDAVPEVLDDGAGIPPEDRDRIFWRFHRLAESRERDEAGTGLGPTISRDIARAHGGALVAADSDRGARFVMRIPLDRTGGR